MIGIHAVTAHGGSKLLFSDVELCLVEGRRYGLVGANGTGKSTFLKLISGEEMPDEGKIIKPSQAIIGWLQQDQFKYQDDPLVSVVLQGKAALWQAMEEKSRLLNQGTIDEATGLRLAELEEYIANHDGYRAESFAEELLVGLGIQSSLHYEPLNTLSGGYKLRVLLAKALFEDPDILLLDEPTNHLDIMTTCWLENYLMNRFKGLLILVSHDVKFLNNVSSHILDIDYGEIREYGGNYDYFNQQKDLVVEQKLHAHKHTQEKIEKMQQFVDKFRYKPSKSKQAMSRVKMIEKMELPDIQKSSRVSPNFQFIQTEQSGKKVFELDNIAKSYGEKIVLNKVKLSLGRGEKVAFIGHNGIGKSTLLKIILGQLSPDRGEVNIGHKVTIAYFSQDHHDLLVGKKSILQWLTEMVPRASSADIRNALGRVLFQKDEVKKNIEQISGGESARLLLAKLMLEKPNVLVLDEPTNHLDLESIQALAKALNNYEGTVLLVAHDRQFVTDVATRIVALTEKKIVDFKGNYRDYINEIGEDYLSQSWLLGS